jgi:hypothetical protein
MPKFLGTIKRLSGEKGISEVVECSSVRGIMGG